MTQTANNHHAGLGEQRAYLHALRMGALPENAPRPRFDALEPTVRLIEAIARESRGNVRAIEQTIATLLERIPALAELIEEEACAPGSPQAAIVEGSSDQTMMPPLPEGVVFPPEASEEAFPCLDEYVQYSRLASPEGYDDFHPACGLWLFSTVAARRVYLQLQRKRIYPSLFLILTARTTLFAKTTTAEVAKEVLHASGLGWLLGADKITPQKLLSDLSGYRLPANYGDLPPERQAWIRQRLAMPGQRGWYYDEFGKFVKAMLRQQSAMTDFAELLLTLDRSPETFENATLARGGEPIEKPYLSLLGSMTPATIRDNAKAGAEFWGDGFWARFAFLVAPLRDFKNASFSNEDLPIPDSLQRALRAWNRRLGVPEISIESRRDEHDRETGEYTITRGPLPEQACTITQGAYHAYDSYRVALRSLIPTLHTQDLDGSYGRLPEIGMRIAILMASLENDNHIEQCHWAKAQELAEMLRRNLHELYAQVNLPEQESERREQELLAFLATRSEPLTAREMKQCCRAFKHTPYSTLREALDSLAADGLVTIIRQGKAMTYQVQNRITEEKRREEREKKEERREREV